jgi:hypothetical protein
MYTVDGQDKVIPCEGVPPQSAGAPMPIIVANDIQLVVVYDARGDERVALRFEGPRAHYFGSPNDEALSGHPLNGRGLGPYGAYEVLASSWIRSLERMNRVHPRHNAARYAELRHFIFTFHDKTFECVAKGMSVAARVANNGEGATALKQLLGKVDRSLA